MVLSSSKFRKMADEIRDTIKSFDIKSVSSEISRIASLNSSQELELVNILTTFLDKVWFEKDTRIELFRIKEFTDMERRQVNHEIYSRIIKSMLDQLDARGLDGNETLFEAGRIRLTARQIFTGKVGHETSRIIFKNMTRQKRGFFKRKDYQVLHLEADYPESGRWGDYTPIEVWLEKNEDVDLFMKQLNKAVQVGNFIAFADIFKRFQVENN